MAGFLDIKRLRYFRAIAEHGSLSAAARALHLAQPALSHHVTELESQIGLRLLHRRNDGVSLTEAGESLLRHAIDIVGRIEAAEADLLRLGRRDAARIRVRLAVISSLAADLTPILVAALARQMPELVLRITELGTLDSRELLERGEADFAIYLVSRGDGSERLLATEPLYFVTAGTADMSDPIGFAEVSATPLVLPASGNPLRVLIEDAAARAGRRLDIALEVDGAAARRNAVLAGLGSTIFGAHSVHGAERRAGLVVRPIVAPALQRSIFLGARRGIDPGLASRITAVLAQSFAEVGGMDVEAGIPR